MQILSAKQWWVDMLASRGLTRPDGRPIFRYRITDEEYDLARTLIRQRAIFLSNGNAERELSAVFICYCAEQFKRENTSTERTWQSLTAPVKVAIHASDVAGLIEPGLRFLGRRVLKRGGSTRMRREWLLTVALQAGLPIKLLVTQKETWLTHYLEAVLSAAFQRGHWDQNEAMRVAHEHAGILKASYQDDDFFELVAELAFELRYLRDCAPNTFSRGPELIAWLDAHRPNWRDALPMVLGDEATTLALNGLVATAQERAALNQGGKLRATRSLSRVGGEWSASAWLEVGGTVKLEDADPEKGRIRLWPTGALAQRVPGDIGFASPPAGKGQDWRLNASTSALSFDRVPWTDKIGLECRSVFLNGPIALPLAGGDPIRAEVLAFAGNCDHNGDVHAAIEGVGSVSSRAPSLLLVTPAAALVEPIEVVDAEGDDEIKRVGTIDNRWIWQIKCGVYVSVGETDSKYRVQPNSDPNLTRLRFEAARLRGWYPDDRSITVVNEKLSVDLVENGVARFPRDNEVEWRIGAGEKWTCIRKRPPPVGRSRLRWRDTDADITLDSHSVFCVPGDLEIRLMSRGLDTNVTLKASNTSLWFEPEPGAVSYNDGRALKLLTGRVSRLPGLLCFDSGSLPIFAEVMQDGNMFVDQDGRELTAENYTLAELLGAEAISHRPGARLILKRLSTHSNANRLEREILFTSEQRSVSFDRIERLIQQMRSIEGTLDSTIRITFGEGTRPYVDVVQFKAPLNKQGATAVVQPPINLQNDGESIIFRSLLEPWHELDQVATSVVELNGISVIYPPSELALPALVYIRRDHRVLTRPLLIEGPSLVDTDDGLAKILSEKDRASRLKELKKWFQIQPLDKAAELISKTAASLNGLPATSLDIFSCVPNSVLAYALLKDEQAERFIWALENELPFTWISINVADWGMAIQNLGGSLWDQLQSLGAQLAASTAKSFICRRIQRLVDLEPCLDSVFDYVSVAPWTRSLPLPETLDEAQKIMQAAVHDHIERHPDSVISGEILKTWMRMPELAACSIVDGSNGLSRDQRLLVWDLRQLFPQGFEAVFSTTLVDLKAQLS